MNANDASRVPNQVYGFTAVAPKIIAFSSNDGNSMIICIIQIEQEFLENQRQLQLMLPLIET